jgi:hypothetical protein
MTCSLRGIALLLMAASMACTSSSPSGPADPDAPTVVGTWSYRGSSPARRQLQGTMQITTQRDGRFSGHAALQQRDGDGSVISVPGLVGGRLVEGQTVDFDVVVDASRALRHLGTLRGDSITGTWIEDNGVGVTGSGTFVISRTGAP